MSINPNPFINDSKLLFFIFIHLLDLYFFVETVPKYKDGFYNGFARTIFWLLRGSNLARVLTDLNETFAVKGLVYTSDRTASSRQLTLSTPPQESLLAGYVARANVNNIQRK